MLQLSNFVLPDCRLVVMPVNVEWINEEKTIIQYNLTGRWDWNELYPEYDKAIKMEKSVSHMVDVILDLRESMAIPPNVLTHLKNITDKQPDNVGLCIFVTNNHFAKILMDSGTRFYPKIGEYFQMVADMDEALDVISDVQEKRKQIE